MTKSSNPSSSSTNVVWHHATVTRERREQRNNHKGTLLWFTGLSGSGKSTIAHAVEERLYQIGCHAFVLDGDNVRHGLCADLSFSKEDREENIRRVGEMAKLFVESGVIILTAFISPFGADRERVKRLLGEQDFIEIFCYCPIEVCEQRDVKGLYKKARLGLIKDFTGISSPYEVPQEPALELNTDELPIEGCVNRVVAFLKAKHVI